MHYQHDLSTVGSFVVDAPPHGAFVQPATIVPGLFAIFCSTSPMKLLSDMIGWVATSLALLGN